MKFVCLIPAECRFRRLCFRWRRSNHSDSLSKTLMEKECRGPAYAVLSVKVRATKQHTVLAGWSKSRAWTMSAIRRVTAIRRAEEKGTNDSIQCPRCMATAGEHTKGEPQLFCPVASRA